MITNSKNYCIDSLSGSLKRTASWRRSLQTRFKDPRNERAAIRLDQLASEVNELSDESWLELRNFCAWDSWKWSDAVSAASRQVEYRGVNTLPAFTKTLLGILSEQNISN
jgi:hypothetical protein